MPRRDGTGPIGMGAMTGRRAGCLRNGCFQNFQYSDNKAFWETQEIRLENQLKFVKERLLNLNSSAK